MSTKFCTVTDVKKSLKIDDIDSDVVISDILEAVSAEIETRTNRKFEQDDYVEYFDGDRNVIHLNNYPIDSITSIYDDYSRVFGPGSLVPSNTYTFDPYSGSIYFDYKLSYGERNIKVSYTGGYEVIPFDVKFAAIYRASALFLGASTSINTQEGSDAIQSKIDKLNDLFEKMIEKYVRPPYV